MPRHAHGRSLLKSGTSRAPKRKSQRNAALNALETAERQNPDATSIRQHRLGESEDGSDDPRAGTGTDTHGNKRRKVTDERELADDVEEGSDLEGGTWHTGVDQDDEDSDLDSEEAFGESDEEKFADFTFRGSGAEKPEPSRRGTKPVRPVDLDEDAENSNEDDLEGTESDDLGDEAIDLATAWDMDDADQLESRKPASKKQSRDIAESDHSTQESEHDDDSNGTEDEESQLSVSEDELEGDAAGLRAFVEGLSNQRDEKGRTRQPKLMSTPSEPSRFGLPSSKLSAADLLQYVKDPTQRQSLKILQSAEHAGTDEYRGGVPGKLSAPLAKRQQDKLNRGAAYEKSKETLNRWIDTVKQNRRADHLTFPLADHAKESALGQKQFLPTTQSVPVTDLEMTINEIMQESGLGNAKGQTAEEHEQAFEELAEKKMDVEDVKARRAELRRARELMFREEIRAKRIKKIKSKAFRRVHRKERDRIEAQQREALAAAGLLNSDEEREKQDRRRAEERMGARHRESRWAKGIKQAGRATWDDDARAGVSDLARRDEELRRRMLGKEAGSPGATDDDSTSESDYDADTDQENSKLSRKMDSLASSTDRSSKSRLEQMAFMQRAEAVQKAENDEEIRQLRLAMDSGERRVVASDEEIQEPQGRQRFGLQVQPKTQTRASKSKNEFEARLSEDEDELENDKNISQIQSSHLQPSSGVAQAQKDHIRNQQNDSSAARRDRSKIARPVSVPKSGKSVPNHTPKARETALDEYTSPSESDDDRTNGVDPDEAKAALAMSIFAGPEDVDQEFSKEKAEVVEEEGDQVIDTTLPGWGSWAGAGISKREQKKGKGRFLQTVKGIAPEKRQDANLERVIINEKKIKKNGKYLATELPHPYESRQQYERSLRLPIGPEWSTTNRYQDAIKPRVLLKQGTVIRPIAKPLA